MTEEEKPQRSHIRNLDRQRQRHAHPVRGRVHIPDVLMLWGAMIYGIYKLIRGFWYKMNPESLLEKAEEESKKEQEKK